MSVILAAIGFAILAQDTVRVGSEQTCSRCRIVFERIAEFGSPSDNTSPFERGFSFALDSRQRIYVAPMAEQYSIGVYTRSGSLLRTIGRHGGGPGEFNNVSEVKVMRGDTLIAYDIRSARLTLFSHSHEVVSTIPMPPQLRFILPQRDGSFIAYASIPTRDRVGRFLHRISRSGEIQQSFGPSGEPFDARETASHVRILAQGASGIIWSARQNRYLIEAWTANGELRRVIIRQPAWFEEWTRHPLSGAERPRTRIRTIFEDEAGLLWVILRVPDRRWRPDPAARPGVESGGVPTYAAVPRYEDSIVEVIDPRTGALLISKRFDEAFADDMSGGHGYLETQRETSLGVPRVTIWKPRLVRQ